MIFITGADWRFLNEAKEWRSLIEKWGYKTAIYNLGHLSIPDAIKGFEVKNNNFITNGWFNCIGGHWFSTGWWKPSVIADALNRFDDNIVYLDADAKLQRPVDEIRFDFDIGVVRREDTPNLDKASIKVFLRGKYNAGVIFFRNCLAIKDFVSKWIEATKKYGNDQAALSMELEKSGFDIKVFEEKYNQKKLKKDTVIQHITGGIKNGRIYRATDKIC